MKSLLRKPGLAFTLSLALMSCSVAAEHSSSGSADNPTPANSLTVLPILLGGQPAVPVSELVAFLLEKQGLPWIEIGNASPPALPGASMETFSAGLTDFVRAHPPATDYVLLAAFNGDRRSGLDELRAALADKSGRIVWSERLDSSSAAFNQAGAREPMTMAVLLGERLAPQLGLDASTARDARPGKFARLMEERSGLPPQEERDALPARQQALKAASSNATLLVIPVLAPDHLEAETAARLAQAITNAHFFQNASAPAGLASLEPPPPGPNELKMLWDLARTLRDALGKKPAAADYVLGVDYRFDPANWERGYVHFVVCDREGRWVIADLQNSHQPDYRSIKPASRAACEALILQRLGGYLDKAPPPASSG